MADKAARPRRPTFAGRVVEIVLHGCRRVDAEASIASVLRDSEGRTVVRVRASDGSDSGMPVRLLQSMQRLWPLAKTSVVENAIDSIVEAEIVIPTERDEMARAYRRAAASRIATGLNAVAAALCGAGVLVYVAANAHLLDGTA